MSDQAFWILMSGVAFVTSIVSGILGMAGGMLLLTVLLLRLEPMIAIPVHGIVQLLSNGSRAWFLRVHVQRRFILPFALPLLPAAVLGLWVLDRLSPAITRMLIGAFVAAAVWRPKPAPSSDARGSGPSRAERLLPLGGALIGFCSTLVGATGPLLAPFILALELSPPGTVGTLAACQVFQHASKVIVFGAAGFDFQRHALPAIALSACAVLGSAVGTRWLERIPRDTFERMVRWVLTLLSLELFVTGATSLTP